MQKKDTNDNCTGNTPTVFKKRNCFWLRAEMPYIFNLLIELLRDASDASADKFSSSQVVKIFADANILDSSKV